MQNLTNPQSLQITQEQKEDYEKNMVEYFYLCSQARKLKKEIVQTKLKGLADLRQALIYNEQGIKQVKELTKLESDRTTAKAI